MRRPQEVKVRNDRKLRGRGARRFEESSFLPTGQPHVTSLEVREQEKENRTCDTECCLQELQDVPLLGFTKAEAEKLKSLRAEQQHSTH